MYKRKPYKAGYLEFRISYLEKMIKNPNTDQKHKAYYLLQIKETKKDLNDKAKGID